MDKAEADKTLQQMARNAIQCQDAPNPLGLARTFAQHMAMLPDVLRARGESTATGDICAHPIFVLWASKLHSLANLGVSDLNKFEVAMQKATEWAG